MRVLVVSSFNLNVFVCVLTTAPSCFNDIQTFFNTFKLYYLECLLAFNIVIVYLCVSFNY